MPARRSIGFSLGTTRRERMGHGVSERACASRPRKAPAEAGACWGWMFVSDAACDANNRLIQWGGKTFSCDANGNLVSDGANPGKWSERDQPKQILAGSTNSRAVKTQLITCLSLDETFLREEGCQLRKASCPTATTRSC